MTDFVALKEAISKSGLKTSFILESLGISRAVWCNRINGKSQFQRSETEKLRNILKLSLKEWHDIFFANDVGLK